MRIALDVAAGVELALAAGVELAAAELLALLLLLLLEPHAAATTAANASTPTMADRPRDGHLFALILFMFVPSSGA